MAASATPPIDDATLAASGRRVLDTEARGLDAVGARLNGDFSRACRLLLACRGRVVCIGMGKSGHVARTNAATFASPGTPASSVHPREAGHGDPGMINHADLVLVLPDYRGRPARRREGE